MAGRRPGSPGTGPEAAAGVVTGEWPRAELVCLSVLPHASHAHWTFLFFRPSSVKDSSFVEKMKKTVSFLYVCALPSKSGSGARSAESAGQESVGGSPAPAPLLYSLSH